MVPQSVQASSAPLSPDLSVLKVCNVPSDLTLREALLIFSLCINDIHSVDVRQDSVAGVSSSTSTAAGTVGAGPTAVYAKFTSPKTAAQVRQLLNNKRIFGPSQAAVSCELTHDFNRTNSLADLSSTDLFSKLAAFPHRSRFPFEHSQDIPSPTSPSPPKPLALDTPAFPDLGRGFSAQRFDHQFNNAWSSTSTPSKLRPENINVQHSQGQTQSALTTPLTDWSQSHFFQQTPILMNEHSHQHQPQPTLQSLQTPTLPTAAPPASDHSSGTGPDLSLLARVPPPANPADQNPPCNTLYVGNLPPDASEMELRALFQPQAGFRRLSFRTKQNSSGVSHHGPMCFVEFEDVAHATRALAELYGRQLVRANGAASNKGGIRLSFSKNPLGVRGPSHRRQQGQGQQGQQSQQNQQGQNQQGQVPQNQQQNQSAQNGKGYSYFNGYQFSN